MGFSEDIATDDLIDFQCWTAIPYNKFTSSPIKFLIWMQND